MIPADALMNVSRFFYNIGMTAAWPFLYLYYGFRARTDGKYRSNRRQRLGFDLPERDPAKKRLLWVHALSVGETLSIVPLVRILKQDRPEMEIVFSNATEAGAEIARNRLGPWVKAFFYLPHDFPWAVRSLAERLRPDLFILVETDLWPNLLLALRKRGVPTVLVNGRISPRSFRRYKTLTLAAGPMLSLLDLVFAQSREDASRYEGLGLSSGRVFSEGNLKFDAATAQGGAIDPTEVRRSNGIAESRPVWVAGSTHEGEEETLLHVHKALKAVHPDLLLILAPRRIQRGQEVASLCRDHGLTVAMRTGGGGARGSDVYILDTMGELSAFYAIGDAAFIGGSLVAFGGHNPLEALVHGKPALWGPHLFNFREMEASLLQTVFCQRVSSQDELLATVVQWLTRPDHVSGESIRAFLNPRMGASERIARILLKKL